MQNFRRCPCILLPTGNSRATLTHRPECWNYPSKVPREPIPLARDRCLTYPVAEDTGEPFFATWQVLRSSPCMYPRLWFPALTSCNDDARVCPALDTWLSVPMCGRTPPFGGACIVLYPHTTLGASTSIPPKVGWPCPLLLRSRSALLWMS